MAGHRLFTALSPNIFARFRHRDGLLLQRKRDFPPLPTFPPFSSSRPCDGRGMHGEGAISLFLMRETIKVDYLADAFSPPYSYFLLEIISASKRYAKIFGAPQVRFPVYF